MGKKCGICGKQRRFIQVLVGRPKGKRLLEIYRRRFEGNIGMDIFVVAPCILKIHKLLKPTNALIRGVVQK
jgi:hypothetical protein